MAVVSSSSMAMEETIAWLSALLLAILLLSCCETPSEEISPKLGDRLEMFQGSDKATAAAVRWNPCDEIYIVTEGETLQSIGDKCGDPFIVEENPHIHDPDDVFPGLVIKITPFKGT